MSDTYTRRVIAVANQKGGVGKTTTAVALATLLSEKAPTLAVDCDPQANLTQSLNIRVAEDDITLFEVLRDERSMADAVVAAPEPCHNLDVVPAVQDLIHLWRSIAVPVGTDFRMRNALDTLDGRYRYIVLDCPPSLDMTTINALVAADEVIVPVDISLYSVSGMYAFLETVNHVRRVNPRLAAPRPLVCKANHTNVSREIVATLKELFPAVFPVPIPNGRDVPMAQMKRHPLPLFAPTSKITSAYRQLVEELTHG